MTVCYGQVLLASVRDWLPAGWFGQFPVRGGTQWRPQRLIYAAVLMGWGAECVLTERFEAIGGQLRQLCPHWPLGGTYTGFAKAWRRWQARLVAALAAHWRRRQAGLTAGRSRCGWRAVAVDGSRFEAARSAANKRSLGCAGRKKTGPQCFLTVAWDLAAGLPWDYRIGPGTASERAHLLEMLEALPAGALVLADAGFVGFELWRALLAGGRHFLLRVGSNARLLTGLGFAVEERADTVYLWPRRQRDQAPLVLRRIVLGEGSTAVHLLTDVVEAARMPAAQAAELYALRWEAEIGFRTFKQTLERRRLRSATPEMAQAELTWAVLGLWLLGALTASAVLQRGGDPLAWSAALARRAVRRLLRQAHQRAPGWRALVHALSQAVRDEYVRQGSKKAKDWPHKKRDKPPGAPKITAASAKLIEQAQRLAYANAA